MRYNHFLGSARHHKEIGTTMQNNLLLFAYGTLRTTEPESKMFQHKLIESKPARIFGRLYQIQEGYPVLQIPNESVIAHASDYLLSDWMLNTEQTIDAKEPDAPSFAWIQGELLTFPLEEDVLESMDAWEGFTPGKKSFYKRVITQAYTTDEMAHRCWAYVCLSEPRAPSRPLKENSWTRPKDLKY
ncbi:gamma-glutamylcyclotransferase [Puniceicoccaceae bacterium K14]|nr:gamma-glutamylcyclotransferase [Puniceicoccaceae bacterium K14]